MRRLRDGEAADELARDMVRPRARVLQQEGDGRGGRGADGRDLRYGVLNILIYANSRV